MIMLILLIMIGRCRCSGDDGFKSVFAMDSEIPLTIEMLSTLLSILLMLILMILLIFEVK